MTTRPQFRLGRHLLPGVIAIAVFAVMAAVILRADLGDTAGFPSDASVTADIGMALLNAPTTIPTEGFLVAFILIALVLDAALDGAVYLAGREKGGRLVTALRGGDSE